MDGSETVELIARIVSFTAGAAIVDLPART